MEIRAEQQRDIASIRALNEAVFETRIEANLVDALRQQAHEFIALVAEENESIIGHIFFSPVTLMTHPELRIMGLAPMAVMPARQRIGVGSALVHEGLAKCKKIGYAAVIVLGHPGYYPRFGFAPASRFGIRCEYEVPDEVFMALELEPGVLQDKTGTIRYHAAFANV
jgi:putative acetyltransferase